LLVSTDSVPYRLPEVLSRVHTSNSVDATFDFVETIVQLAAFDSVASTLLLVWTGLYGSGDQ